MELGEIDALPDDPPSGAQAQTQTRQKLWVNKPAAWRSVEELARKQSMQPSHGAKRIFRMQEQVQIGEYAFFLLDNPSFEPDFALLVSGGVGGLSFGSAATEHDARVRVEIWSAPPPNDTSDRWERSEIGAFYTDRDEHVFEGAIAQFGDPTRWPVKGYFGLRAYCAGAAKVQKLADQLIDIPKGSERWLVQFWLMPAAAALMPARR